MFFKIGFFRFTFSNSLTPLSLMRFLGSDDLFFTLKITTQDSKHLLFRFDRKEESCLRDILVRNSEVGQTPPGLGEFYFESPEESLAATIEINIKGSPHLVHISSAENAELVAKNFVQEYKLQKEVARKIEIELMRAQNDLNQNNLSKLRHHISHLYRLAIDAAAYEARAITAENHSWRLSDYSVRIANLLPQLETRVQHLVEEQHQANQTIKQLKAQMQLEKEVLVANAKEMRRMKKRLETAVAHCHDLQSKLISASTLLTSHLATKSSDKRSPGIVRNLSDEMSGGVYSSPQPSVASSSQRGDAEEEASRLHLTRAVSQAVSEATQALVSEYERKMVRYEFTVSEQTRAMETAEKENAGNKKYCSADITYILTSTPLLVL
jgi:hypothetical protein